MPSPQRWRFFFFFLAVVARFALAQLSFSISFSVAIGLEPLVWVSLNSPSKKSADAVLPLPWAAVIAIRPRRVSIELPI